MSFPAQPPVCAIRDDNRPFGASHDHSPWSNFPGHAPNEPMTGAFIPYRAGFSRPDRRAALHGRRHVERGAALGGPVASCRLPRRIVILRSCKQENGINDFQEVGQVVRARGFSVRGKNV